MGKDQAVFVLDDPDFDATDWASPGWFRGRQLGMDATISSVNQILDDTKGILSKGKYNHEGMEQLRTRIRILMQAIEVAGEMLRDQHVEHANTVKDLSLQLSNVYMELSLLQKTRKALAEDHERLRVSNRTLVGRNEELRRLAGFYAKQLLPVEGINGNV